MRDGDPPDGTVSRYANVACERGAQGRPASDRLVNFRDLGGLTVTHGGTTRYGVLYRSDAPHPDDAPPDHVAHWPPSVVVDLRMEKEAARLPYDLAGAQRILYPLHAGAAPENVRTSDLVVLYRHILDTAADRVAGAAKHIVTQPGPVLVHCTAGKDRTGIVVAALLLSAGVAESDVVADYTLTTHNMDAVVQRIRVHADLERHPINEAWLRTPTEAIAEVVRTLNNPEHGGARGWLIARGTPADSLDEWLDGFVEPVRPPR